MNKFLQWSNKYNSEITWFIVGLLTQSILIHLSTGQVGWALIDVIIIGINLYFWKDRRV